jgi:hypothetical protein
VWHSQARCGLVGAGYPPLLDMHVCAEAVLCVHACGTGHHVMSEHRAETSRENPVIPEYDQLERCGKDGYMVGASTYEEQRFGRIRSVQDIRTWPSLHQLQSRSPSVPSIAQPCMVHAWCMHGARMVHARCTHGARMVHAVHDAHDRTHHPCTVHAQCMHSARMVHVTQDGEVALCMPSRPLTLQGSKCSSSAAAAKPRPARG